MEKDNMKTVRELLDSKGITYNVVSAGSELNFPCPACNGKKFYVNPETGEFYCFHASCNVQGGIKKLLELLRMDNEEVRTNEQAENHSIPSPDPIPEEIVDKFHQNLLDNYSYLEKYFIEKRGYKIETIKKNKLGWSNRGYIIIPISDEKGNYLNFKFKPDPTKPDSPKGMFSIKGRGQIRLFNSKVLFLDPKPEYVIISEGEWDCMMLDQQGYVSVTSTGGAGSFKPEWIPFFQGIKKIYICQDNDANQAGQKGALRIAEMFSKQKIDVYLVHLPNPNNL